MNKYKVGDKVRVLIGKDKGRDGTIERIFPKSGRAIVPNINMYKKHVKGTQGGQKGGIYDVPRAIALSKLAVICPKCKKPTRIGFRVAKGSKVRVCLSCKREIVDSKSRKSRT